MDGSLLLALGQRLHAVTVSRHNYLHKCAFSKQQRNKMIAGSQAVKTTACKSIRAENWNSCICWEPRILGCLYSELLMTWWNNQVSLRKPGISEKHVWSVHDAIFYTGADKYCFSSLIWDVYADIYQVHLQVICVTVEKIVLGHDDWSKQAER